MIRNKILGALILACGFNLNAQVKKTFTVDVNRPIAQVSPICGECFLKTLILEPMEEFTPNW